MFLRHVLRSILDAQGFADIRIEIPPIKLCTDNALMIAWAATEMWEAGYCSSLEVQPLRKWVRTVMSFDAFEQWLTLPLIGHGQCSA